MAKKQRSTDKRMSQHGSSSHLRILNSLIGSQSRAWSLMLERVSARSKQKFGCHHLGHETVRSGASGCESDVNRASKSTHEKAPPGSGRADSSKRVRRFERPAFTLEMSLCVVRTDVKHCLEGDSIHILPATLAANYVPGCTICYLKVAGNY